MVAQKVILSQLNRKVPELKQNFSVRKMGLFGSAVRNKADKQSDIDILVDLAEPTFDHYMDLKFSKGLDPSTFRENQLTLSVKVFSTSVFLSNGTTPP